MGANGGGGGGTTKCYGAKGGGFCFVLFIMVRSKCTH